MKIVKKTKEDYGVDLMTPIMEDGNKKELSLNDCGLNKQEKVISCPRIPTTVKHKKKSYTVVFETADFKIALSRKSVQPKKGKKAYYFRYIYGVISFICLNWYLFKKYLAKLQKSVQYTMKQVAVAHSYNGIGTFFFTYRCICLTKA